MSATPASSCPPPWEDKARTLVLSPLGILYVLQSNHHPNLGH